MKALFPIKRNTDFNMEKRSDEHTDYVIINTSASVSELDLHLERYDNEFKLQGVQKDP